jgi:molybdate transport system substrate-binding protein
MKNKILMFAAGLLIASSGYAENLIVLAAASTTDAMKEAGARFTKNSGHTIQFSFDSSGTLTRQIQSGAPADLFLSANERWMNALSAVGNIKTETRADLLANRLVLIAPVGKVPPEYRTSNTEPQNTEGNRLRSSELLIRYSAVSGFRLAVGNMDSVPAGMYAKQVLEKMGLLDLFQPRLVSCDSVRNVLFFVERGEVDAGIVYATDAKISERIGVVSVFPEESHDPIRYPVAVCATSAHPVAAGELCAFLQSEEALAIFESHGFERTGK